MRKEARAGNAVPGARPVPCARDHHYVNDSRRDRRIMIMSSTRRIYSLRQSRFFYTTVSIAVPRRWDTAVRFDERGNTRKCEFKFRGQSKCQSREATPRPAVRIERESVGNQTLDSGGNKSIALAVFSLLAVNSRIKLARLGLAKTRSCCRPRA